MNSPENNSRFIIKGGNPLRGTIKVAGAKNSATKLIVASLLTKDKCTFYNSPNKIKDLQVTTKICSLLGSKIEVKDKVLEIQTKEITNACINQELGSSTRIAILLAGPLVHRFGKAEIPIPGGCRIGSRPVNLHIDGLKKLGCNVQMNDTHYIFEADGLKGAEINLDFPSVGATENILIASIFAKGKTVISNAAVEPEIIDLIKFLQKMGAIIEVRTDRKIIIEGVKRLYGTSHRVIPDRNEVASFACAAIASKGDIIIEDAIQDDLITLLNTIRRVGAEYQVVENGIRFFYKCKLRPIAIETSVHPGFMTDWQQPFVIMMTQANGITIVHETVYEKRFGYVEELKKMGAEIELYNTCLGGLPCRFASSQYYHSAVVKGPTKLKGAEINIPDLRAGFSYLIAGVIAEGESIINGAVYIDRGYEDIDLKFQSLGADIKRVQ
ncbi:MAG: UDP-N-acetylglucosamine 1-carboxyvinyltransferase [Ignavibacteria bacterium]|nr:UDP-N-acetylglucosamine 1-carboxyvinyltransferase [Ignavibacteria bacterium]